MSDIRNILADTIADRAETFGDTVTHVASGLKFSAEIEVIQDMTMNEALGRDPREECTFHVLDKTAAATLALNDQLYVEVLATTFRVLRRSNNPASSQVDFGVQKIVKE